LRFVTLGTMRIPIGRLAFTRAIGLSSAPIAELERIMELGYKLDVSIVTRYPLWYDSFPESSEGP